jgi:hypothetical protein
MNAAKSVSLAHNFNRTTLLLLGQLRLKLLQLGRIAGERLALLAQLGLFALLRRQLELLLLQPLAVDRPTTTTPPPPTRVGRRRAVRVGADEAAAVAEAASGAVLRTRLTGRATSPLAAREAALMVTMTAICCASQASLRCTSRPSGMATQTWRRPGGRATDSGR